MAVSHISSFSRLHPTDSTQHSATVTINAANTLTAAGIPLSTGIVRREKVMRIVSVEGKEVRHTRSPSGATSCSSPLK